MLTSSHAHLTWRLTGGRPHRAWRTLGGVLPDLPGWALGIDARARGLHGEAFIDCVYHRPITRALHRLVHGASAAALAHALSAPGSRTRALAEGWAGHLAVDYATHHDDAWPPLWPLTDRVWPSPVSYWQREHHARAWTVAELSLIAVLAARGGPRTPALTAAAIALVAPHLWPPP